MAFPLKPKAKAKKAPPKGKMVSPTSRQPDQDGDYDQPPMGYKRGGMVKKRGR